MTAYTVGHITKSNQPLPFAKEDYPHLAELEFSMDIPRLQPLEIDLLIGEPLYSEIVTGPIIKGETKSEPVAWGSTLGYFLGGMYSLPPRR